LKAFNNEAASNERTCFQMPGLYRRLTVVNLASTFGTGTVANYPSSNNATCTQGDNNFKQALCRGMIVMPEEVTLCL
jgi:hypothetical protein